MFLPEQNGSDEPDRRHMGNMSPDPPIVDTPDRNRSVKWLNREYYARLECHELAKIESVNICRTGKTLL